MQLNPHVEKKILPLITIIRDKALRRGDWGFLELTEILGLSRKQYSISSTSLLLLKQEQLSLKSKIIYGTQQHSEPARQVAKRLKNGEWIKEKLNERKIIKMTLEEFKIRMEKFGIILTSCQCEEIVNAFKDSVGYIIINYFMDYLKNTMNENRKEIVREAFISLMKDEYKERNTLNSNNFNNYNNNNNNNNNYPDEVINPAPFSQVEIKTLFSRFNPKNHPNVQNGTATPENILSLFNKYFNKKENISYEEFICYYSGVSRNINNDDIFINTIKGLWGLYIREVTPPPEKCFIPCANNNNNNNNYLNNNNNINTHNSIINGTYVLGNNNINNINNINNNKIEEEEENIDSFPLVPRNKENNDLLYLRIPNKIVGYTGHIPNAHNHFSETFYKMEREVEKINNNINNNNNNNNDNIFNNYCLVEKKSIYTPWASGPVRCEKNKDNIINNNNNIDDDDYLYDKPLPLRVGNKSNNHSIKLA